MTAEPLRFPVRDRRVLLWLLVAAICWRWVLASRAPLPGVDAATDLWAAAAVAEGRWSALAAVANRPLWAMLLAPLLAGGAPPLVAAQLLACLCGGLVLVPVAMAAERLRQGAGVPAAVAALACVGGPAAAAGAQQALVQLLAAGVVAAWVAGRRWLAALGAAAVLFAGGERLVPALPTDGLWQALRAEWSLPAAFAVLSLLPPRPRRIAPLWLLAGLLPLLALALPSLRPHLADAAPVLAVLAGVGLARWPQRRAELVLAAFVVVGFHTAWQAIEPKALAAERRLGAHLRERLAPGDRLVSDRPRLLWAAGQPPTGAVDPAGVAAAVAGREVGAVVLSPALRRGPGLGSAMAGRFVRYQVPAALRDGAADLDLEILLRRE